MRTDRLQHGCYNPAILSGFVAVLVLVSFVFASPARAVAAEPRPLPSPAAVCADPSSVSEPALHRVAGAPGVRVARLAHPVGLPAVLHLPLAARSDMRPGNRTGAAVPASGPPVRVLFCTWLN